MCTFHLTFTWVPARTYPHEANTFSRAGFQPQHHGNFYRYNNSLQFHPVHCRMFYSIPDLYPGDTSSTDLLLMTIKNVSRYYQIPFGDKNCPSREPLSWRTVEFWDPLVTVLCKVLLDEFLEYRGWELWKILMGSEPAHHSSLLKPVSFWQKQMLPIITLQNHQKRSSSFLCLFLSSFQLLKME